MEINFIALSEQVVCHSFISCDQCLSSCFVFSPLSFEVPALHVFAKFCRNRLALFQFFSTKAKAKQEFSNKMSNTEQDQAASIERITEGQILPSKIHRVWNDMTHNYYYTFDWSPKMYVLLAYQGFISVADSTVLVPEIQKEYCILRFENVKAERSVKKRSKLYSLTMDKLSSFWQSIGWVGLGWVDLVEFFLPKNALSTISAIPKIKIFSHFATLLIEGLVYWINWLISLMISVFLRYVQTDCGSYSINKKKSQQQLYELPL
jgi:hypothetical protein